MARRRYRLRPSKSTSAISFGMGIVFVIIGIFVVIPATFRSGFFPAALFGVAWTGIAGYMAVLHGLYLFGKRDTPGLNSMEIVTDEEEEPSSPAAGNAQERLKQLQELYDQRLISAGEYEEKRKEILKDI